MYHMHHIGSNSLTRYPDLYVPYTILNSEMVLVDTHPKPITKILAFDLEWSLTKDRHNEHPIIAVSFCDSHSFERAYLLEDFLPHYGNDKRFAEKALLNTITATLMKYDTSIGFYTTGARIFNRSKHKISGHDSDLIQLDKRLKRYQMESPVWFSKYKLPYLTGYNREHLHIDTFKLFKSKIIQTSVYNDTYNSYDLDTISRAILGNEKGGKFDGLSGPLFESLTDLNEKRNYALLDAQLVMWCVAHNDYELLKMVNSVSNLTGIEFKTLCGAFSSSKIWTPLIDTLVKDELSKLDGVNGSDEEIKLCDRLNRYFFTEQDKEGKDDNDQEELDNIELDDNEELENEEDDSKKVRYIGGWVYDNPVSGVYNNVGVLDITSLYPTMIVNNNISFETPDCYCCKDNVLAQVPGDLFEVKTKRHLCQKYQGILTKQIIKYREKRIQYKNKARELSKESNPDIGLIREYEMLSNTYKILINSAYGQLGYMFAKYENVKAAELVTRYGRYTIQHCKKIAEKVFGWEVIYGDTDSLFINNYDQIPEQQVIDFKEACEQQLTVQIEIDKVYERLLLHKKKNYVGVLKSNQKLVIKGMGGKKSDRCLWVKKAFKQALEDYRLGLNPCGNLRTELNKLDTGTLEKPEHQLIIFKKLGRDPDKYKVNNVQKILGKVKNLEEGDSVRFYLSDSTKVNNHKTFTEKILEIGIKSYKRQLVNTVKPILVLLGYDIKKELDMSDCDINTTSMLDYNKDHLPNDRPVVSIKDKPITVKTPTTQRKLIQLE